MTYVIAGVSGNTGSVVASTLLQQGEKVRVIVRSVAKGEAFRALGAEVAVADLTDTAALTRALDGARGAYLLLPPFAAEGFLAHQAKVTASIQTALEQTRVPHVVFLSSVAAQLPSGTGPILAMRHAEERLRQLTRTAFTFLRPSYFMENFASSLSALERGAFQTFVDPARRFPTIATVDIGKVAARSLVERTSDTQVLELAGPGDVTIGEVAAVFAKVLGKPLALEVAPVAVMPDVLTGFGFPRDLAQLYADMTAKLNAGELVYEGHKLERGTTHIEVVAKKLLGKS